MSILKKILNFVLYSNLWIAIAAVCMVAKTVHIMKVDIPWTHPLYGLAFFATLFIYAGHRIVGLQKNKAFQEEGRHKIIAQFKHHIFIYALIGILGTAYFAFQLSWQSWIFMAAPALISLAYVFPIFKGGKQRLRDINNVKIFFVALVWTVVSVGLPCVELEYYNFLFISIIALEVFLFVFAITIPFDIRDLHIDKHLEVQTIPAKLGIKKAKQLSYVLLFASLLFTLLFSTQYIFMYLLGYGITLLLLILSNPQRPDFYYTGLLDGTMILIPILIILGT